MLAQNKLEKLFKIPLEIIGTSPKKKTVKAMISEVGLSLVVKNVNYTNVFLFI